MITPKSLAGQHIAVFGLGKAGQSTVKSLASADVKITAWDDNENARQKTATLAPKHLLTFTPPTEIEWNNIEMLVLSPGVPFTHPEPHPIVKAAQQANVPIICDVEILYRALPECNYIGITGTNGKSTTTVLIGHILKQAGKSCEVGGNLGIPVLDLQEQQADGVYVLELSSYQLDLLQALTCNVSVITNITPDHLDRHGGMEGYIKAKKRIYRHQGKEHVAVIHVDNPHTYAIYEELAAANIIGTLIPCSCEKLLDNGISIIDNVLTVKCLGIEETRILPPINTLAGKHNAENSTVALAAVLAQGVTLDDALAAMQNFPGLRHRMQYLQETNNLVFVNDSKATNAEAAAKALGSYNNILWIAGGQAKEGGIDTLEPYFSKINHAYLIGEAQHDFAKRLEGKVTYTLSNTLEQAIEDAIHDAQHTKQKQILLLSPACASFDQWPSFEARGDYFCQAIEEYCNKNK